MTNEVSTLRTRVQHNANDHAAWHALGLAALNGGNLPFAIQCLETAIAVNGGVSLYQRNICEMYRRAGRLEQAAQAGRQAVRQAPDSLDAHYNLGLVYTDAKDFSNAIDCYRRALQLDPQHNLSWNNLGSALEQLGNKDEALSAYEKALGLDPRHAEAQNNAGAIYSEQGRLDAARCAFEAAIAARPDFVEAHYNLSSLKTYRKDDPHLATLEGLYGHHQQLDNHARIRYCFALGKALDDIGEFDRAFAAYAQGNSQQHALLPHDEARADALLAEILRVFDAGFFATRKDRHVASEPQRIPIFIVGMPRSGTTLLEQILCSHASVHGAGELTDLNDAVLQATHGGAGKFFTAGVTVLSPAHMKALGDDYLARVWKLSPGSRYITDKMPANFFYLGLIHLALPQARIIHAMRDPMDSCFSCYSRLFNDTMAFAYDQASLGNFYRRYMTLMRHWHAVLPPGSILDVSYEEMVADTEAQARRVLEFVGLPWDPACMEFYKNERRVRTASVAQVRKPIYKSSVARWKHFAKHLRPLFELVKDFRPADDTPAELLAALAGPAAQASTQPRAAEHYHAQGTSHYRAGRIETALACYEKALALLPDFPAALNSKGFALQDLDRMDEALACFARAVELAPEMAMARLNLGMAQLKLGDWESGWENYEARWTGSAEANAGKLRLPSLKLPQWYGETGTAAQGILVVTEQGFGDTFQFSRYLPLLTKRFAKVGFLCSPPTARLLEWSFGEQVALFTSQPADTTTWHWQCPLMSLPLAFATRLDSIPADLPYLRVTEPARRHWEQRLEAAAPTRLRIGIAWAGRKEHQYNARRSLTLAQIEPFLRDERVTWVSLQKWALDEYPPEVPGGIDWIDWTAELGDFADTAALIANLDLVISVGSVNVHLAGALDRPVWMLDHFDNEWRWLNHREDSPWYPNLRIFRQRAFGEWGEVIERLKAALAILPAPRPLLPRPARPRPLPQAYDMAPATLPRQVLPGKTIANLPEAHRLHQHGIAAWQAGQASEALRLIRQAIAVDGSVALFHSNLAEMNRQSGRLDDAISHGEQALRLDPSLASAHSNLGIAYYDAKRYDDAESCHRRALALVPDLVQSLNNLGSIARARKDLKSAAQWYRQVLAIKPDFPESLSNLGAVLVEDDQPEAAQSPLLQVLRIYPNYPEALCNLGLVRFKQNRTDEAVALLRQSLQIRPDYVEALIGLGRAMQKLDQPEQARVFAERAKLIAPEKAEAWCLHGNLAMERGETNEAEAAFQKALEIVPGHADALTALGNLRLEQGSLEQAVGLFQQAITQNDQCLSARFQLVQARTVKPGDSNLAALEAMASAAPDWSKDKKTFWHYALGKAYDDLKDYDRAFPHFMEGARLKRSTIEHDMHAEGAFVQNVIETVDGRFIEALWGAGDPSDLAVFVLGMPRSGTTLTEQIIASHPQVQAAGELYELMNLLQSFKAPERPSAYPENLSQLSRSQAAMLGQEYVAKLRQYAPQARHIVDKMPANYLALGVIPLILPRARIIHVKRNPIDTCLSCFTRLFNRHQNATYELHELGRHYAHYQRLMEHWRNVLPASAFLEVQYEDIVADLEGQARRLIGYLGLEWSDNCLAFHQTTRNVRTASQTQVRQPLYRSSLERWKNYAHYLQPLIQGLNDQDCTQ